MARQQTQVLIVGGGPCGLMLANGLGRRGIDAILVDQKRSTAFSPQANATQARTMEHFRRLGFADEIRGMGVPDHYPTDIGYFTRYTQYELGRFSLPSARDAQRLVRTAGGSWSAAELPHRVSQKYVEAVLYRHAAELPTVSLNYSWRLLSFRETDRGVEARIVNMQTGQPRAIEADYLFAADGPRSTVRKQLGIRYGGEGGAERDFMGGVMLALYLRAPTFYDTCKHEKCWMYATFNAERRAILIPVDGKGEFVFHTQLRPEQEPETLTDETALRYFEQAVGASIPVQILSRDTWLAGRALVADAFKRRRVLLGGDAVHLFTPTGGMGYNTAIEDAVNAGWKLASVLGGHAPAVLLDSYEAERRPVALRNTEFARRFADSIGLYRPTPALERDGKAGDAARRRAGEYLVNHARNEFNIPGFTFGARYDSSPIIVTDPTPAPPDLATEYVPSGKPGGRAPHVWLSDGKSLFDTFGFEWTLLCLKRAPEASAAFAAAAERMGIDLKITISEDEEAFDLYETDLALIRPDQVVAWRRTDAAYDPADVLAFAIGHRSEVEAPSDVGALDAANDRRHASRDR